VICKASCSHVAILIRLVYDAHEPTALGEGSKSITCLTGMFVASGYLLN
jgi:hypothetical protein